MKSKRNPKSNCASPVEKDSAVGSGASGIYEGAFEYRRDIEGQRASAMGGASPKKAWGKLTTFALPTLVGWRETPRR